MSVEVKAYDVAYENGDIVRVLAADEGEAINMVDDGIAGIVVVHGSCVDYSNGNANKATHASLANLTKEESAALAHINAIRSSALNWIRSYRRTLVNLCRPDSYTVESSHHIERISQAAREFDMAQAVFNEIIIRQLDLTYDNEALAKIARSPAFLKHVVDCALSDQESETSLIEDAWRCVSKQSVDDRRFFDVTYVRYYGVTVMAPDADTARIIADAIPNSRLEMGDELEFHECEELSEEDINGGCGWTAPYSG